VNSGSASDAWRLAERPGVAARALLLGIEVYRVTLSPLLGGFCRFQPSCSVYAAEAVRRHGARRGALLAVRRLLRCQPFHRGGFDPVP
jgi:putative membrane protein insertion efficiency factor